jgi:hypothetical protein
MFLTYVYPTQGRRRAQAVKHLRSGQLRLTMAEGEHIRHLSR